MKLNLKKSITLIALSLCSLQFLFAQSGVIGITSATTTLSTYINPISTLILVIGGIVGFVGAVRVYIRWNNGEPSTNKDLMSWFGSCIFLGLVGIVIRAFFGV